MRRSTTVALRALHPKECKPYFIHTLNFGKDKDAEVVAGLAKLICHILANKQR